MANRQSFHPGARRSSGPRPNRSWVAFNNGAGSTIASGTKVLIARFPLANAGIDETLLRVRGQILANSTALEADLTMIGAVGVAVVSSIAGGAGAASIPGPMTDAGTDVWALWEPINLFVNSSGAATVDHSFFPQTIDSRAKRIVPNGYELVFMAESETGSSFTLQVNFRVLSMVRGT